MFKILDGRDKFYQWDIDRKLIVEDASISEVHFSNRTDDYALVVKTYIENGITLANVPNILLQTDWRIHVYAVDGNYTKHEKSYEVIARTKPSDYVYTETEIINWQYIKTQLDSKADAADVYTKTEVDTELERIKYYGDPDIIPSDESYFTVNGNTIIGLTDSGKTQTELVIPYKINGVSITSIYTSAFNGYSSLTSINIPNSVTSIGEAVFGGCTSLTSIDIPDGVTSIENLVFIGCSSLTSVSIPNSVTRIGDAAFVNCTSLTSINIPNNVTSIGDYAFDNCKNLTIYCEQGSYTETYANTNNIPVKYTDISATDFNNKANAANVYTKTEVDSKLTPITQTAITNPITVNTIYDLGVQTSLSLTLPSGTVGDFIQVDFISGDTPTTLSVTSTNGLIGYDLIPEANMIYSLYFDWGIISSAGSYGWRCAYSEYDISTIGG